MKTHRLAFLFIIIVFITVSPVRGGERDGLSFLRIGIGAQENALGGAVTATATGPLASYWNPAGLHYARSREFTFSYNDWLLDINTHFAGYVFKRGIGTFGISFFSAGVDGIEVRTIPSEKPDGITGSHNIMAGLSYARKLKENIVIGGTLKYLYEKIYIESASGFAFDLGMQYRQGDEGVVAGITLQNVGRMSEFRVERSELPSRFKLGAGYGKLLFSDSFGVTILGDYEFNFNYNNYFLTGAEVTYSDTFTIRGGYVFNNSSRNVSWGLGFKLKDYVFDYCYLPFSNGFGDTHQFSISAAF